jgi:hypothetical protein
MSTYDELLAQLSGLSPEALSELDKEISKAVPSQSWTPQEGPQYDAYHCKADVTLYGGQAGGGKSALIVGLALTKHRKSLIMRRQYKDTQSLIDDLIKQYGTKDGFNGAPPARLTTKDGRIIEFGGALNPGDELVQWRGQEHDLLAIDEGSQFTETQVRNLMGWVRSPGRDEDGNPLPCRTIIATNPPEDPATGGWLIDWFKPWLDKNHPNPAKPGELRYFIADEDGHWQPVDGPDPVVVGEHTVNPQSFTFIPAALSDNSFIKDSGYKDRLDALHEPLRSAIRDGNWMISAKDDEWQVIPTNWILMAQRRWSPHPPIDVPMSCIGVDVAQGGENETVLAPRFGHYFGEMIAIPGKLTPTGSDVAAHIMKHRRNAAEVIVDAGGGYGGATMERLRDNGLNVAGFKGAGKSGGRTADRQLAFKNKRAEAWWRFREALDPDQQGGGFIALPNDGELFRDLVAPRYKVTPGGIQIEDKQEIIKRIGRSPDRGDAVVMAWSHGPNYATHGDVWRRAMRTIVATPKIIRGHQNKKSFLRRKGM